MEESLTKIINALVAASDQLGFHTARLWPQVVAITFVKSLTVLLALLTAGLMSTLVANHARLKQSQYEGSSEDLWTLWSLILIISTAISVSTLLIFLTVLPDNIANIIYPEASTVLHLIGK